MDAWSGTSSDVRESDREKSLKADLEQSEATVGNLILSLSMQKEREDKMKEEIQQVFLNCFTYCRGNLFRSAIEIPD